ncbi:hypothetical protein [Methylocucumis oryzae]|uniref:Uncharacterized protein n=1 Tax=Methylocucumis oryzae TaxID=1632867 RepID=A0A0F3INC4_9GAMM|nr:hypothetical protein [Methylocucumis oryzae]KJV08053.1 hypothetical protein VZ94_00380 [Methylocucumis oryzae]
MDLRDPIYQAMLGNIGLDSASKPAVVFDSSCADKEDMMLDAASMEDVETARLNEETVAAIHTWLETDDLDDNETFADRLFALFVGIFDINKNGELDENESEIFRHDSKCRVGLPYVKKVLARKTLTPC